MAFYLRGVLFELLGNVSNAMDSYKQCKFFSTKFLKKKYYNFTMFFITLQNNGFVYLSVMDELKELKEQKQIQAKAQHDLLIKKRYFQKLKYQKNYNKYYSNITTKHNIYKGEFKKFLDNAGKVLYKEEQNRHSILKKFTKTTYITSTMNMINNLLSKDFKSILEKMDKVEVTKPSTEINGLINRALEKRRQILFNKNNEKNEKIKKKENTFNKKTQSTNINTYGDIGSNTINSIKKTKINYNSNFNNYINYIDPNYNSGKIYSLKQRPLSGNTNKNNIFYRLRNKYNKNKKTRNNSYHKIKNRMNKSDQSSLDTIDNEYSYKFNYLLENNNNNLSIVKNSFLIKSNSSRILKRYKQKNNTSYFNSNYSKNSKNFSSLNSKKIYKNNNFTSKNKSSFKMVLKPKKEFRRDKENFAKDYINKKVFLDKYCNEEIKFHRKLLKSKSSELESAKDYNEFDLKKTKRDAELTFNKIFELCKSSSNKKNIHNYLMLRNMGNVGMNANMTTYNDIKETYSLYETFKEDKKEDRVLDVKEKKNILFKNEEKMKELNMEYEQMIQKENELKNKKIKLLEEIMRK